MDGAGFEQRFDSYGGYAVAMERVLDGARGEICVFDPDLAQTRLESSAQVARLERLLREGANARLRVVVHDPVFIETRCPRLMRLLTQFSHNFEIRQSPADLRNLTECYLLTDPDTGIVRFHRDWPRGKWFVANPDEAGILRSRFTQLWECSTPTVSATRLGL